MRKRPKIARQFFKGRVYNNREEALNGLSGSPEARERTADARLEAQKVAARVRREAAWR